MAVHRRRRVAAITAAGALALAACGGGGDDETAAEQFEDALGELGETNESIEEEVPEPKEPELTLVDLDLPRETTYLGATWTVDEVSYRSAGVDELGVETGPAAVVGYTVANTGEGVLDLPMTAERLSLLDGDDFAIPADTTSAGNGEVLVVGGRSSFEAIFPLDARASRPTTWPTTRSGWGSRGTSPRSCRWRARCHRSTTPCPSTSRSRSTAS